MSRKFRILVDGSEYNVEVEEIKEDGGVSKVAKSPQPAPKKSPAPAKKAQAKPAASSGGAGVVSAPMPGTILDIKVSEGQEVKKGDVLLILEAMKMENEIKSPVDGSVESISVTKGGSVNSGDTMITLS